VTGGAPVLTDGARPNFRYRSDIVSLNSCWMQAMTKFCRLIVSFRSTMLDDKDAF
jgi:hypothetical protein